MAEPEEPQLQWGGRFESGPDELVQTYTASIQIDILLAQYDIAGSVAHAQMLARQHIITADESRRIAEGLTQIAGEIDEGRFELNPALEDIHTHIEVRLTELIGADVAGKLHTARSRNDQVALDTRMFVRDMVVQAIGAIRAMQISMLDLASRSIDIYMPGYTHLQRAQPILFSHHLLAYIEMLERDAGRMMDAYERIDIMPLGSAALAGAAYPLDREWVASELGFSEISGNSIDAVSSRDYIAEFLSNAAICMVNISRLCEDLILWSSSEFDVLRFDDAFTTGSSIMPQKRNPDIAELARGRSGRVIGYLVALLTMLKGLPLAYNRDLQEDKDGLFASADILLSTLHTLSGAVLSATVNGDRAQQMVDSDPLILATDYADYITRKGVPFREAHAVVGRLVRLCEQRGCALQELSLADLQSEHPAFEADAVGMTVIVALEARDLPGGTAPSRVRAAIADHEERLQLELADMAKRLQGDAADEQSAEPATVEPSASASEATALETGLSRAQRRAAQRAESRGSRRRRKRR